MKRTTKTMMAGAAVAGLFAGAFANNARAALSNGSNSTGPVSAVAPGSMLINMDDSDTGKHDCKGMNSCKGQGGCKSSDNGCKGKNDCKGKGGCDTNHPKSS